jgi:predicted transcriptional regulator
VKLTGFDKKQVSNAIYRLIKTGYIKQERRGIYVVNEGNNLPSTKFVNLAKNSAKIKQDDLVGLQKQVFNLIKQYNNGITAKLIKEKSGLKEKQVSNLLYRLIRKGLVQQTERGIYKVL